MPRHKHEMILQKQMRKVEQAKAEIANLEALSKEFKTRIKELEGTRGNMDDEQRSLVQAVKFCDVKTMELQNELAAVKTARQAYVNDLGERLKS